MSMISLGVKSKDLGIPEAVEMDSKEPKEHFPELFIEGVDLKDLPKSGTATIEFKKIRQSDDLKRGTSTITLEIRAIGKARGKDKEASEALDELAMEVEEED